MRTELPPDSPDAAAVRAVASLDDAVRRRIYRVVADTHAPVTREQVAHDVGISRKLAAFHLDKLVAEGLLVARYDNTRRAHNLGRSPKVYERSGRDVTVSLPERQPATLAELLVEAVSSAAADEPARDAALRVAAARGNELGVRTRSDLRTGRLGVERALTAAESALRKRGFEPSRENPTSVRLRNCPFHPLAEAAPDLVCGMNHRFLSGFVAALGVAGLRAELVPRAGECCVELRG